MKSNAILRFFGVGVCCLLILGVAGVPFCVAEEADKPLTKEERATIDYTLVLEGESEIAALFAQPVEGLEEKLITTIEKKHDIEIKRSSMIKTELCLHELLADIANLAKVSTGRKIVRAEIKLVGGTSRFSMWSDWRTRKLEMPVLSITVFYSDGEVAPSEISCTGHKYH